MNVIVRLPSVVEKYAPEFADLFSAEGHEYFKRYLTGLMVSENKTVEGINRLFVRQSRNQSSFNRFMNRSNFDHEALNDRRLHLMQQTEQTRFKDTGGECGVLALDDSLMSHYGSHFDHIYQIWDHIDKRYTFAHNMVSLHYSDDRTDYPVDHRLWLPPDWEAVAIRMKELGIHINPTKWEARTQEVRKWRSYMRDRYRDYQYKVPQLVDVYKSKVLLGLDMLRRFRCRHSGFDLPLAMDGGYTSTGFCKILNDELKVPYVGSLSGSQKIILAGSEKVSLEHFKDRLLAQHLEGETKFYKTTVHYKGKKETYYAYCATHHVKGYPKQRLVISFQKEDLSDTPRYSICNRTNWYASRILRIRRHRWPIETFYQESKAEGLDKYQLRNFEAVKTHVAFVSTAFTMLKRAAHDEELLSTFRKRLEPESDGTLPFLRRLLQLEGLTYLIEFVFLQHAQGHSVESICHQLMRPLVY